MECIDIIKHHNLPIGSALKYLWRQGLKESVGMSVVDKQIQDLEKSIYYINTQITLLKESKK